MNNYNFAIVGNVDDGKSTFLGRLLHDTQNISSQKINEIKKYCEGKNIDFEWSFVLDAFQAERRQEITIDSTRVLIRLNQGHFCFIDAPGHIDFLSNTISAAANTDAAMLLVDVKKGIKNQTRMHAFLLYILGIKRIIVLVNKMDLVGYQEDAFRAIENDIVKILNNLNLDPVAVIPIVARDGAILCDREENRLLWYKGQTVLESIGQMNHVHSEISENFRFPVQDIYKFDERRIIVGSILSGKIRKGDTLIVYPSRKTCTVASIEKWKEETSSAVMGQAIGITLEEPIYVERGSLLVKGNMPVATKRLTATLFNFGCNKISKGDKIKLRIAHSEIQGTFEDIISQINLENLEEYPADTLLKNQCGKVILSCEKMQVVDNYSVDSQLCRFVLENEGIIVGAGLVNLNESYHNSSYPTSVHADENLSIFDHSVTSRMRETKNNHKSGVLWFTGLPAAGKSTLAMLLEKKLFSDNYQVFVMEGDKVRHGLSKDLGFDNRGRQENLRRAAEMADLFKQAGFICITSFISPTELSRLQAKNIINEGFHLIYIKADFETCQKRDPKSHYKKAKENQIKNFTGVSSNFEEPQNPSLTIDTTQYSIEECLGMLINYVHKHFKQ